MTDEIREKAQELNTVERAKKLESIKAALEFYGNFPYKQGLVHVKKRMFCRQWIGRI